MKTCLCIGICQIIAISNILRSMPEFTSIYTNILDYTIFSISEEEMKNIIDNILPTCDLVLSQPVSDNYRNTNIFSSKTLKSHIKPGAIHLIISNCYFTGYDPVPFQTTDENGGILQTDGMSYYPSLSLESLLLGNIEKACIDWCNPESYSLTEIERNYYLSIEELKRRELKVFENDFGVDIKISDYIEKNYKHLFLFHTYNHPTNVLLYELVKRIFNRIGIPYVERFLTKELLGDITIPPSPCIYLKSKMDFKYPSFSILDKKYTTDQVMVFFSSILKKTNKNLHNTWLSSIKYGKLKIS
jgi:hypothetical protein